jgi:hypothetical protein
MREHISFHELTVTCKVGMWTSSIDVEAPKHTEIVGILGLLSPSCAPPPG